MNSGILLNLGDYGDYVEYGKVKSDGWMWVISHGQYVNMHSEYRMSGKNPDDQYKYFQKYIVS